MSKNPVDDLIADLTEELEPCRALSHPFVRALVWILGALAYVGLICYVMDVRPDVMTALSNHVFLFEVILMIGVFMSAAFAASFLCVPDMRGQGWLNAVPLTLLGVFLLWSVLRAIAEQALVGEMHVHACIYDAILMGFVPALAIVFMTSRGATTHPVLASFMGMISVGALGYVTLRFTCMNDTMAHVCLYHFLPYVVLGGVFGALIQRFYRW